MLLTPEQVAHRCSLSTKTVYRAIKRGELRASKLSGRWRVHPDDLNGWFNRGLYRPEPARPFAQPSPAAPVRATLAALRRIEGAADA